MTGDKISILVVDDERSMRDFLKILLQKEGHTVVTAHNGESALDSLKNQEFDLIIMMELHLIVLK